MAGKKTQRKLNISMSKTDKLFRKAQDTSNIGLRQTLREKSSKQLKTTKNLAAASGRRLGLNIDQKIIATRKNAKRRTGNIVESVDNKRF